MKFKLISILPLLYFVSMNALSSFAKKYSSLTILSYEIDTTQCVNSSENTIIILKLAESADDFMTLTHNKQ